MLGNGRLASISQIETLSNTPTLQNVIGIVYDVILDDSHPIVKENPLLISHIGGVVVRLSNDISSDEKSLVFAFPSNIQFKNLPTVNEEVKIFTYSGLYFYERFSNIVAINSSVDKSTISNIFKPTDNTPTDKSSDYRKVSSTNIPRSENIEDDSNFGLGKYFKEIDGIHRLKMYEGDMLIESRFGQSIRFSAYNNERNTLSPTIIIRNGENIVSQTSLELENTTEEDINRDGSTIILGSNSYQIPFIAGTIDRNGSTDFNTKPKSFKNYPNQLLGDQILINSGRVIISSKSGEMIFWSKKNYGFISDGALSIDNRQGIDINVGANINITTNDSNFNINSGNGTINLGSGTLQPMVLGNELLSVLNDLINAITNQVYITPAGNTSPGPINTPIFNSIQRRLRSILSSKNNTA